MQKAIRGLAGAFLAVFVAGIVWAGVGTQNNVANDDSDFRERFINFVADDDSDFRERFINFVADEDTDSRERFI